MTAEQVRYLVDTAPRFQLPAPREEQTTEMRVDPRFPELDLDLLSSRAAARPRMLLPGIGALPLGEPALLSADGGTGKSTFALQMATCFAAGRSFLGETVERMRCAYISFEDPANVMHWRLERACYAANTTLHDLAGWLTVIDGTRWSGNWFTTPNGQSKLSADFEYFCRRLADFDLIVVDGSSDVFAGNENERAAVKAFSRALRAMTPATGALLLLAHLDKQGVKDGAGSLGYSGSTAWNNAFRNRLFMYRETADDDGDSAETGRIVVEVRKSNYGRSGGRMLLEYDTDYNILKRVDDPQAKKSRRSALDDAAESLTLVAIIRKAQHRDDPIPAATAGVRSCHAVMSAYPDFPDELKSTRGRKRFYKLMEKLRQSDKVKVVKGKRDGKGHYKPVLVVSEGPAQENDRAQESGRNCA